MKQSIEIPINVKMCVDESTASGCLKIVEWYINQNGKNIVTNQLESGEVQLSYEPA